MSSFIKLVTAIQLYTNVTQPRPPKTNTHLKIVAFSLSEQSACHGNMLPWSRRRAASIPHRLQKSIHPPLSLRPQTKYVAITTHQKETELEFLSPSNVIFTPRNTRKIIPLTPAPTSPSRPEASLPDLSSLTLPP